MESEKASCCSNAAFFTANEATIGRVGEQGGHGGHHGGGFVVRMMTDEQIQQLRKQIAIYAVLTEQLIEMYYAVVASQEPATAAGPSLGNLYDPLLGPGGIKLTARQRWSPSSMQLEILETIFRQGQGSPSKQKIKEITVEIARHGQVSETNVYNWFQNRRARLKRKQQQAAVVRSNSSTKMITHPDKDYDDNILLMVDNYSNNSTQ